MNLPLTGNRKGNVSSIPLILIMTFSLTVAVLTGYLVLGEYSDAMSNTPFSEQTEHHTDNAASALGIFEIGIILVNVSFYLVSAALVYQITTNPVFALPGILMLAISIWFSAEIANMYQLFTGVPVMQSIMPAFSVTTEFYQNLPVITAALGSLILILLYGKTRQGVETTI